MVWRFWLAVPLLLGGLFFLAVGTIGLLRLPDIYTRMHATGKCDTLGAGLILLALVIMAPTVEVAVKLLLMVGLICVINPTTTHVIANVAYRYGGHEVPGTPTSDLRQAKGAAALDDGSRQGGSRP
ncbi:MAG: monovalent cation/H(+) antiporter subunit G [Bacillota bacterium]|nr:monovalent cation/H(+) antiporter subunit G [Bacillota bacterium]